MVLLVPEDTRVRVHIFAARERMTLQEAAEVLLNQALTERKA